MSLAQGPVPHPDHRAEVALRQAQSWAARRIRRWRQRLAGNRPSLNFRTAVVRPMVWPHWSASSRERLSLRLGNDVFSPSRWNNPLKDPTCPYDLCATPLVMPGARRAPGMPRWVLLVICCQELAKAAQPPKRACLDRSQRNSQLGGDLGLGAVAEVGEP